MAYPKKVWDYEEVERAAAAHKKSKDIMDALSTNTAMLSKSLRNDEEFREAYNRGRSAGGFKLYQSDGEASNGNGAPAPKLDEVSQEVFEALRDTKGGLGIEGIKTLTGYDTLKVSNAIRTLSRMDLVHYDGANYSVTAAAAATKARTEPTAKRQAASSPRSPKAETNHDAGKDVRAPQARVTAIQPDLNGHTSTARALEGARVELLYQWLHGEPSPKAFEIVDSIENELERLVRAAGAGA